MKNNKLLKRKRAGIAHCLITSIFALALFFSSNSFAAIELYTSLAEFIENAGPADALITNEQGVMRANEVVSLPTQNQSLGNKLVFDSANTQFDFSFQIETEVSPATFVFEDFESPAATPANFINALSVGDIDGNGSSNSSELQNDNWSLSLLNSAWVTALGVDIRDNNFQDGATASATVEKLLVYSDSGALLAEFNLSTLNLGSSETQFLGVIATAGEQIGKIFFNEDNGGDDIAIANFRFATDWEAPADIMNSPRRDAASALTFDNRLIIAGGSTSTSIAVRTTEYLNLDTGEFTQVADLNIGRERHSLTLLPNGNLLALGGGDSNFVTLSSAEIFDVKTNTWQLVPSMSVARSSHTATRLFDGRVLVVGGSTYEIFDPTTNAWSTPKALDVSRSRHAATIDGFGKVWVTGGGSEPTKTSVYDPDNDTWSTEDDLNTGRSSHMMVTLADGRLAVVGNVKESDDSCRSGPLEILDPTDSSPTWDDSYSDPVFDKCNAVGGLLSNGQLFAARVNLVTGLDNQVELEVYDQDKDRWDVRLTGVNTIGFFSSALTLPSGKLILLQLGGPILFNPGYDLVTTSDLNYEREQVSASYYRRYYLLVSGGGFAGSEIVYVGEHHASPYTCESCPDENFNNGSQPKLVGLGALPPDYDDIIIQGGGFDSGGYSGDIYQFEPSRFEDPLSNEPTAQAVGQLKIPRSGHTANVLHDGRVLFVGGLPEQASQTGELFDPRTGRTTFAKPPSFSRQSNPVSVVLPDGRVFIASGSSDATPEIYDPDKNTWFITAPLNKSRTGVEIALLTDGRVMAAGGGAEPTQRRFVEIYDPDANTWTEVASLNVNRLRFSLTALPNGLVLAAGGLESAGTSTEIYDPITDEWTLSATLPFGAEEHATVHLGDHRVALIGGEQSGKGKIQIYQWNKAITPTDTFDRLDCPSDATSDCTISDATIRSIDIAQLAASGQTEDFGANAPIIYVRRLDGGATQRLQPSLDQNWFTSDNEYNFNWENFAPASGLIWVNGIFNGTPLNPKLVTIPYDSVKTDEVCFPIKTTLGSVVVICL